MLKAVKKTTSSFYPRGFRGVISSINIVQSSQKVGRLSEEQPPIDVNLPIMARWAMNYLIHNPLPERNYECRFSLYPTRIPVCVPSVPRPDAMDPVAIGDTDVRMALEFIYMREICASNDGKDVEEGLLKRVLGYVGKDGLSRVPPYSVYIYDGKPRVMTWTTGRTLMSVTEIYRKTKARDMLELGRKMVSALRGLSSWDTGRAWHKAFSVYDDGIWTEGSHWNDYSSILEPIVAYAEASGDTDALEFAIAFSRGTMESLQENLGKFVIEPNGRFTGHTHLHLFATWGVAHLGAVTRDPQAIQWAKSVYEFVLNLGMDWGWFPEKILVPETRPWNETCITGDMTSIAACLARAGYTEYWDHVERFVRNYIREVQFFITAEFKILFRKINGEGTDIENAISILRHFEGGFLSSVHPNDLFVSFILKPSEAIDLDTPNPGERGCLAMAGCCSPEGMRAMYTAWNNVVTEHSSDIPGQPAGVYVNMSFNRDAPQAKVISFLPYNGRLTVLAKKSSDFFLRPPSWTCRNEVKSYRNGKKIETLWSRDYIRFPGTQINDEITIIYPLVRFTQKVTVGPESMPKSYTIEWCGNTVTGIEPKGKFLPMFVDVPQPIPAFDNERR